MNKKISILTLFISVIFLLTACGTNPISTTDYTATFTSNDYVTVTIYDDSTLSNGSTSLITNAIDENGNITSDGTGSVYFSLSVDSGYQIDSVTVTPSTNYDSLTTLSTNTYQITNISGDVIITVTTSETSSNTSTTDPYVATFVLDDNVTVTVYDTQDYTDGTVTTTAYAKDGDTGEVLTDGEGQINFIVTLADGYEIDNVLVTPSGNYNNLKDPTDLELDNTYRVTKVEGDITITVTTKLIGTESSVTEFTGTFVLDDHVSVTVYDTQELTNGTVTTTAYAKDSDTGEIVVDGSGQINFVVTLEENYVVDTITVAPTDNYNNLKYPIDLELSNTYRITKITGDVIITITTHYVSSDYDDTLATTIVYADSGITVENNNGGVTIDNGIATIAYSGTYEVTGSISEGSLVVSASDEATVDLLLYDLSITSDTTSPVNIQSADKVNITIDGTLTLTDNRSTDTTETDEAGNAALYSAVDLDIDGTGSLYVYGYYNNGIGTKDDLELKEVSAVVVAYNNAIKGNDSLTIESGTYDITSTAGDGLKTSNSDISDNGNQRGIITISGGTITINAASDGIDASYDVVIENNPIIYIYTSTTYATGVGAAASSSTGETNSDVIYLMISSSINTTYRYAVYYTNSGSTTGVWVDADYYQSMYVDGRLYYFFTVEYTGEYSYFTLYQFTATTTDSLTTYVAKTSTQTVNTAYDTIYVSSRAISGTTISISWTILGTSSTDPTSGTSTTTSTSSGYSEKGIKADNSVTINGGTIEIYAYDDGIHANSDVLLETGSYGTGNVTINGGTITITTKDDGIHADSTVYVTGGTTYVLTSYEAVEGNIINVSGGTISVYATDDGFNASSGSTTPKIIISGGYIDITTGSGDTDSIDSNGSYTQTGGFVVSRAGLTGGAGGALDTDGSASITGGTFIGIGYSEVVTSSSGDNLSTGSLSITLSSGTYTVEDSTGNVIMTFTVSSSYSRLWISSDLFDSGTYKLIKDGTTVKTFSF